MLAGARLLTLRQMLGARTSWLAAGKRWTRPFAVAAARSPACFTGRTVAPELTCEEPKSCANEERDLRIIQVGRGTNPDPRMSERHLGPAPVVGHRLDGTRRQHLDLELPRGGRLVGRSGGR